MRKRKPFFFIAWSFILLATLTAATYKVLVKFPPRGVSAKGPDSVNMNDLRGAAKYQAMEQLAR